MILYGIQIPTMKINFVLLLILSVAQLFAQQPKLILPIGHTAWVSSANFSSDGKKIVTASGDKSAKIWDASSGILLADLKGHTDYISSAEFSPDDRKIITASKDHHVKIWDAGTGILLADLKGHTALVNSASFSPDGKKILTASSDGLVKIWNAAKGSLLLNLKGHNSAIWSAQFTSDNKKIVSWGDEYTVEVWDAITGSPGLTLKGSSWKINSVEISPDGRKILCTASDNTAKIWDINTGKILLVLKGNFIDKTAKFSPDGKKIITSSWDNNLTTNNINIWDASTGKSLIGFKGHISGILSIQYSRDGKKIVTTAGNYSSSGDNTTKIWEASTGTLLKEIKEDNKYFSSAQFSPDGKKIVTTSGKNGKIWNAETGALQFSLQGHTHSNWFEAFSPDGQKLLTVHGDHSAKIWDAATGRLLVNLKGHENIINKAAFSPDGKKIVTGSEDGTAKIWDASSGDLLSDLKRHLYPVRTVSFSADGKKIVTADDYIAVIWDASTGKFLSDLIRHSDFLMSAEFSPDSKQIVTSSQDTTAKIWDANSGKLLFTLKGHTEYLNSACFSPASPGDPKGGKKILTTSLYDSSAIIWDASSGALIARLKGHTKAVLSASFSADGRKVITASADGSCKIWNANSGKLLQNLDNLSGFILNAKFSPSTNTDPSGGRKVFGIANQSIEVWDLASGKLINEMKGHESKINSFVFSTDGKEIISSADDNTVKVWDIETNKLKYTFIAVDSTDYLVYDNEGRFDGTEGARKLLYLTCGKEVIKLDQIKDQLWVPDLAERINKGETINSSKLSDLNICGLIPLVESVEDKIGYRFKIAPQRGGLGQTILYINGIETKIYEPGSLKKVANGYELFVARHEVKPYFVSGILNKVTVKSYTKDNQIASRGADGEDDEVEIRDTIPPNLYAIFIGVSDYKGTELDLKYAAKDAVDIAQAISLTSTKLLGSKHVFIYNLNTGEKHDKFPEKKSIKDVFAEIGKRSTPNDILMVFFAGHGVILGENKQFYFLTADASSSSINPVGIKDAGISTGELMEWMRPANIKAQKRILILDACNSGGAINQIMSIGKDQGYLAARNDDKAQEIKQIDKLNEKSGMYVLAASASNQSAYEMGRYSQGILTYALLKVIKEHPEVLEQSRYLNVTGWFNTAVKMVSDIVHEANKRQEPQLITTTNFNIGIVDNDVLNAIILPNEKPLFAASIFQNIDEAIAYDNLELGKLINDQFNDVYSRGTEGPIAFVVSTDSPDAFMVTGKYEVKGDEVKMKINIRQNKDKIQRYKIECMGKKNDLKSLADLVIAKSLAAIRDK